MKTTAPLAAVSHTSIRWNARRRGEVDSEEKIQKRVEFDLYYIENWSVLFDLFILLKTPLALMTKNENAY